ncbi:MAG: DUF58 domain-containing protein [Candidatus Delongbacteria bacterium]|nr:DUF58 domain-containing protein [Candidatus Delongbacteria bacterium]
MEKESYKKYLDPSFIANYSNLKLTTNMILEGFMIGIHSSPMKGFSAEFSQHKQYNPGDPTRFIDWKIFGKTEKYYIKQYEDETNLYANIFLDKTTSMAFKAEKSTYSKLDYGKQLAAAIAGIFINQKDSVGYGTIADSLKIYIPPKSSRQQLKTLLINIDDKETYDSETTADSYESVSLKLSKSGLTVIISDFLEDPDKIIHNILLLRKRKQDIIIFMIADDYEYNLNFKENSTFVDSETGEKLVVKPSQLKKSYKEVYDELIKKYKNTFTENKIYFKFVTTLTPFDIPLREIVLIRSIKI